MQKPPSVQWNRGTRFPLWFRLHAAEGLFRSSLLHGGGNIDLPDSVKRTIWAALLIRWEARKKGRCISASALLVQFRSLRRPAPPEVLYLYTLANGLE